MKKLLILVLAISLNSPASAENHLENVCLHSGALYHAKFNEGTAEFGGGIQVRHCFL